MGRFVNWPTRSSAFQYNQVLCIENKRGMGMVDAKSDICEKLKKLGFARSNRIKLYGEEIRLLSDPFPHESGIAVEASNPNGQSKRTVRLPLPILKMAMAKTA